MSRFLQTFAAAVFVLAFAPALCFANETPPEAALNEAATLDSTGDESSLALEGGSSDAQAPDAGAASALEGEVSEANDAAEAPMPAANEEDLAPVQVDDELAAAEGLSPADPAADAGSVDDSNAAPAVVAGQAEGGVAGDAANASAGKTSAPAVAASTPAAAPRTTAAVALASAAPAVAASQTASKATPSPATPSPALAVAGKRAPARKATAIDATAYLVHNAVYYLSSALAKKGAYVVGVKDISGAAKTNVVLSKQVRGLAQYWRAVYRGKGVYRFVNYAGGYYLAVQGNVKNKANVYVAKSGVIDWKLVKNADGSYSLRPATGKKAFLSVTNSKAKSGANIRLWGAISNKGQKFSFTQNKRLTKAYEAGRLVEPGVVKLTLAGTDVRLGMANDSTKSNAKVKTAANAKALSQVFQMEYAGNGLYEFRNANSYQVLSASEATAGAAVVQNQRTRALNQLWYLEPAENGYRVISAQSGLALDVAGGKALAGKRAVVSQAGQGSTQQFEFSGTQLVENGTYILQSALSAPFVLAVKGNSKAEKANVQINRSFGNAGEKFRISYVGDGAYRIVGASSKLSIDVESHSKRNGANVQMAKKGNAASQKWVIELGEDGLRFKSLASGKYLTVKGPQAKTGANVTQRTANGSASQAWHLLPKDWKFYSGASTAAMKLIRKAESYEGWRYQWGGRSPSTSFDCAGLVMYCANQVWGKHFDLMNTNAEMLYGKCKHISAAKAKPGDLVFYQGTYGSNVNYISHVVIYAGNGYMYGAGDPIGYSRVNAIKNIRGKTATALYARIR